MSTAFAEGPCLDVRAVRLPVRAEASVYWLGMNGMLLLAVLAYVGMGKFWPAGMGLVVVGAWAVAGALQGSRHGGSAVRIAALTVWAAALLTWLFQGQIRPLDFQWWALYHTKFFLPVLLLFAIGSRPCVDRVTRRDWLVDGALLLLPLGLCMFPPLGEAPPQPLPLLGYLLVVWRWRDRFRAPRLVMFTTLLLAMLVAKPTAAAQFLALPFSAATSLAYVFARVEHLAMLLPGTPAEEVLAGFTNINVNHELASYTYVLLDADPHWLAARDIFLLLLVVVCVRRRWLRALLGGAIVGALAYIGSLGIPVASSGWPQYMFQAADKVPPPWYLWVVSIMTLVMVLLPGTPDLQGRPVQGLPASFARLGGLLLLVTVSYSALLMAVHAHNSVSRGLAPRRSEDHARFQRLVVPFNPTRQAGIDNNRLGMADLLVYLPAQASLLKQYAEKNPGEKFALDEYDYRLYSPVWMATSLARDLREEGLHELAAEVALRSLETASWYNAVTLYSALALMESALRSLPSPEDNCTVTDEETYAAAARRILALDTAPGSPNETGAIFKPVVFRGTLAYPTLFVEAPYLYGTYMQYGGYGRSLSSMHNFFFRRTLYMCWLYLEEHGRFPSSVDELVAAYGPACLTVVAEYLGLPFEDYLVITTDADGLSTTVTWTLSPAHDLAAQLGFARQLDLTATLDSYRRGADSTEYVAQEAQ